MGDADVDKCEARGTSEGDDMDECVARGIEEDAYVDDCVPGGTKEYIDEVVPVEVAATWIKDVKKNRKKVQYLLMLDTNTNKVSPQYTCFLM